MLRDTVMQRVLAAAAAAAAFGLTALVPGNAEAQVVSRMTSRLGFATLCRAQGMGTSRRDRESVRRSGAYTETMDAKPMLVEIGRTLRDVNLEAVLIGNAAAALQGAPVTTIDFDFLFRKTPRNMAKLKALAARLRATVLRPYYPASDFYRVTREDDGLQLDFMAAIHGIRSFEGLRSRATAIEIGGVSLLVASLADVIRSKKAAGRPRDLAVVDILEKALEAKAEQKTKAGGRRERK